MLNEDEAGEVRRIAELAQAAGEAQDRAFLNVPYSNWTSRIRRKQKGARSMISASRRCPTTSPGCARCATRSRALRTN